MLSLLIQASCLLVPGAFPESQDRIEALHRRTGIKFMKKLDSISSDSVCGEVSLVVRLTSF